MESTLAPAWHEAGNPCQSTLLSWHPYPYWIFQAPSEAGKEDPPPNFTVGDEGLEWIRICSGYKQVTVQQRVLGSSPYCPQGFVLRAREQRERKSSPKIKTQGLPAISQLWEVNETIQALQKMGLAFWSGFISFPKSCGFHLQSVHLEELLTSLRWRQ